MRICIRQGDEELRRPNVRGIMMIKEAHKTLSPADSAFPWKVVV